MDEELREAHEQFRKLQKELGTKIYKKIAHIPREYGFSLLQEGHLNLCGNSIFVLYKGETTLLFYIDLDMPSIKMNFGDERRANEVYDVDVKNYENSVREILENWDRD